MPITSKSNFLDCLLFIRKLKCGVLSFDDLFKNFVVGSSLSRVSSSSPSSTTPTEAEAQSYHSPAHATSSELEDEAPPPPIASRPERTKSIVSF